MLLGKKIIGTIAYMGGVTAVPEPFLWSWSQMVQYNADYMVEGNQTIFYNRVMASYHSFARNVLVDTMQGDWLLMLDTDHEFEPDLAARMLFQMNKHNIDVLVGIYQYKREPYPPVLYRWNDKGTALEPIGKWDSNATIFQIGSAGGGCMMVRKKVFDEIQTKLHVKPFDICAPFSEDHSFFKYLRRLRIKAYCHPDIQSHHLIYKALSLKDYDMSDLTFSKRHKVTGFK
jgi:hypothetical protein